MKLVKPNWVTHDGSPIFSVDIHPDGKRFATGGQGGDSGRVVIWNMEPVLNETTEADLNIPKLLCQMDHHLACVNCVRWSKGGLLASGGDDKLIMIWRFCPGVKGSTLFGSKAGVEMWRCQTTLRCHQGDILDLAWAPHNPWLASASVDNTVIIWNTTNSAIVSILRGHTGLVKGVTWDPIGRYIASQSDDKSLRVWRTTDWKQETVITEPFEECGGTTHVLRLSWSPDGQYLVSAHAMNGGGPTAQIIERDGWKHDKDYVGHRKAVTCVRFNGNILQKNTKEKKAMNFCCAAIGSRDCSLSVWSTCLKRPMVVIHELFVSSILDISWSACGMQLCACSKDGTVVFVQFTDKEIGQPLDASQQVLIQERLYGKLNKGGNYIIEDPELLISKPPAPPSATITKPPSPVKPTITNNSANSVQKTNSNSTCTIPTPVNKQIETKTTDGKRRITPMFIPLPSDSVDPGPSKPVAVETSSFSSGSQIKSSIVIEKRDEIVKPNVGSTINLESTSKEKEPTDQAGPSTNKPNEDRPPRWPSPDVNSRVPVERGSKTILLPSLKPTKSLSQIAGLYSVSVNKDQNVYHLQVYRGIGEELIWNQILGYKVTALASSSSIVAVSLEDGTVHTFYTAQGGRATPPLVPPSPIAKLQAAGSMIMVISCYADVRVWEILPHNSCRLVISTSAAHLITPGTSLLVCTLHNGMPHIALTNARAYIYHKEMGSWILAGDSQDPTWRWSLVSANNMTGIGGRIPSGPLAILQEGLNRTAGLLPHLGAPFGASCIMSFFEQQLLVSKAIKSPQEYVHWLLAFVQFLCTHDDNESKLRPILDELLGPVHETASKSSWDPLILGQSKHTLLEEILKILSKHLQWQRLYLEYTDQFRTLKEFLNENSEDI